MKIYCKGVDTYILTKKILLTCILKFFNSILNAGKMKQESIDKATKRRKAVNVLLITHFLKLSEAVAFIDGGNQYSQWLNKVFIIITLCFIVVMHWILVVTNFNRQKCVKLFDLLWILPQLKLVKHSLQWSTQICCFCC